MPSKQPPPEAHSTPLLHDRIASTVASSLPLPLARNATIDKTILLGLSIEATIHSRTVTAALQIKQTSRTAPCDTDTVFYHLRKLTTPNVLT